MKKLLNQRSGSLFIYTVLVSMAIYLIVSLVSGGRLLTSIFFYNAQDTFMDFFNSIRDASQGIEAYTVRKVIYPPMANLIFQGLSLLTPDSYNQTDFEERMSWPEYGANVALISVCVAICMLLLALLVYLGLKVEPKSRWAFTLMAVLSVPCLNMMERGNIMVLALIALMIYALTYHSERAIVRELGLFSLAFSFSLKLYPVLFAWILIGDKRYKEVVRCALYSLALLLLPSFAFGGPSCLLTILKNILSFSSGSGGVLGVINAYTGIPHSLLSALAYVWFALCVLQFMISPFLYRLPEERWRVWTWGCIAFLTYPPLTTTYGWALFLIPMIMMHNEGVKVKDILGYWIPMTIPFVFLPVSFFVVLTGNAIMVYICMAAISIYATVETVMQLLKRRKKPEEAVTEFELD